MNASRAEELISELIEDPVLFERSGKANLLLEEFHKGLPISRLRELLQRSHVDIVRNAMWVASELGAEAIDLADQADKFSNSSDTHTRFYSLELLMVISAIREHGRFARIIRALEDEHKGIHVLTMGLIANASSKQIEAVTNLSDSRKLGKGHLRGLRMLQSDSSLELPALKACIDSDDSLIRKYGAIVAARDPHRFAAVLQYTASSSDADVREFATARIPAPRL